MILNHLLGFYTQPKVEWQHVDKNHENYGFALSHIAIISLIPSIVCYYASAYLGWSIGAGEVIKLTSSSALFISIGMYFSLVFGVIILAMMMKELAKSFDCKPSFTQVLELAAYTATPLYMVGFAGLYPTLWFVMLIGFIGLAYSVYLLYAGVPIIMHMHEDKGFIYSSSVVTCGLVLLVILMTGSVILWSVSGGLVFTS